jgi:hypothetical protein
MLTEDSHSFFEKIPNQTRVWRYMDFTKFVSLLDRKELFFSKVDKFGDPYEGIVPNNNYKKMKSLVGSNYGNPITSYKNKNKNKKLLTNKDLLETRKKILINSWHINEYESAAMWELYSSTNSGIAIQTTYGKLTKSFEKTPDQIYIGKVKYVDYNKEDVDQANVYYPFLHKRKSFSYENELRVITELDDNILDSKSYIRKRKYYEKITEEGKYVSVDLKELVHRIYVSPKAEPWLGTLVISMSKKYGIPNNKVRISKLYTLI